MTTEEELKVLLNKPVVLFVIMLFGMLSSVAKQMRDAKKNGSEITYGQYLAHWPELMVAIGYNVVAFVGLIQTDTLNVASAWATGYVNNSLSDISIIGGRSKAIVDQVPDSVPPDER